MTLFVAIVSGFASGVFLRSLFFESWSPIIFVLLLLALFGAFSFLRPRLAYTLGAVFLLCVALGMIRASFVDTPLPETFVRDVKHRVSYDGVVVADPDIRDKNQRVEIRVQNATDTTIMLAVAPHYPSVAVGDRVRVSGTLELPTPFADNNGRVFRYDKYLQRDGVRFLLNFAYLRVEQEAPWYSLPAGLARMKHLFIDGLQATLPEPHASLAGGVAIGGKSGLGNDLKAEFMRSGLIHMVVLSGHNVMVVASWVIVFFTFVFAKIGSVSHKRTPRGFAIGLGALALILFVGVAGTSSTAIRAALMAMIALYARATGRTYVAGRTLFFVILLMLLWNPLYLVFDPGFGLSVVATAGLIWLAPLIETWLEKRFSLKSIFWKEVIATTIAAQIAVLPLLLYDTGNLSLVALPANILVMPVTALLMGLAAIAGFAGIVFGSFAPILGIMIAFPTYLASSYVLFISHTSASLPFAAFTLPLFPFWLVLVAYAILIYFIASKRFSTIPQLRLAKNASM